jgi:hypothetical protein
MFSGIKNRITLFSLLAALALPVLGACGGDDSSSGSNSGASATQTPFIAPSPYTTEEALQKFDEVVLLAKAPDRSKLQEYGITEADLQQRISLILNGTSDTTGLDDARTALNDGNRILAAEYIHNVVTDYVTPAFGPNDTDSIGEQQLDEIDPGHTFVDDHSQGMFTTAVFKAVAVKLIELWYRVLPG